MKHGLLLVVFLGLLCSCASTRMIRYDTDLRKGYTSGMTGLDTFVVEYRCPTSMDNALATQLALYYTAERCLELGYPYFVVLEDRSTVNRSETSVSNVQFRKGYGVRGVRGAITEVSVEDAQPVVIYKVQCFDAAPAAGRFYTATETINAVALDLDARNVQAVKNQESINGGTHTVIMVLTGVSALALVLAFVAL